MQHGPWSPALQQRGGKWGKVRGMMRAGICLYGQGWGQEHCPPPARSGAWWRPLGARRRQIGKGGLGFWWHDSRWQLVALPSQGRSSGMG